MLLPTTTHRSFSAELLPNLSDPTLQSCQHSSFPGQELVFVLAGFHNVPVWGPLKSSPAFKHASGSPSLISSANLIRSTLKQALETGDVSSHYKIHYLSFSLPPLLHSLPSSTNQCRINFHHPTALYIHRKYCRSYLDFQHIRHEH